jgi:hypothetical protein
MTRATLAAAMVLLFAAVLWSDDKPKDDEASGTPAEQYKALAQEYNDAYAAFLKAYREAKTDEERKKASELFPQVDKYASRFLDLAKENPKDPAAIDALVWIVSRAGHSKHASTALEMLKDDHLESPKMAQVCQSLLYVESEDAEKILRAVIDKNKDHDVQAQAYYALAMRVKRRAEQAGEKNKPEAGKLTKEAEDLFERVVADFADVKHHQGTMGDAAKGELYEIRFLANGKVAPEIEGEDIEGAKMKLSDFKGKVVLLDFWGNW